jgi:hypothetical protein
MSRGGSGEGEPVGRSNMTARHASRFEGASAESVPRGDHCHRRHLVDASIGEYRSSRTLMAFSTLFTPFTPVISAQVQALATRQEHSESFSERLPSG